mmetsp:Transcript_15847/g.46874  ORF Transcript_15847/g.46874 Transcript_15847/m.46874 type:complete len:283 (-) Transcript_15847:816-1664(-)
MEIARARALTLDDGGAAERLRRARRPGRRQRRRGPLQRVLVALWAVHPTALLQRHPLHARLGLVCRRAVLPLRDHMVEACQQHAVGLRVLSVHADRAPLVDAAVVAARREHKAVVAAELRPHHVRRVAMELLIRRVVPHHREVEQPHARHVVRGYQIPAARHAVGRLSLRRSAHARGRVGAWDGAVRRPAARRRAQRVDVGVVRVVGPDAHDLEAQLRGARRERRVALVLCDLAPGLGVPVQQVAALVDRLEDHCAVKLVARQADRQRPVNVLHVARVADAL